MNDDNKLARLIFETQETAAQRRHDVRTNEAIATDIRNYRPLENDWPGVDTRGALPNVQDWEEDPTIGEFRLNVIPKSDHFKRGVVDYVNWYGDKAGYRPISLEKEITWSYYRTETPYPDDMPILVFKNGSRIYRSNRVEPFDAKVKMQWYGNRDVARVYQDMSYSGAKVPSVKEIAPYRVKEDLNLVDLTKIKAITNLMRQADNEVVKSMKRIFFLSATEDGKAVKVTIDEDTDYNERSIVVRESNVPDDNIFCLWFEENLYKFDGWCFIRSLNPKIRQLQGHHEEIFLNDPDEAVERLHYAIKEVNWHGEQTARVVPKYNYERV